jgi:hypothetical protein
MVAVSPIRRWLRSASRPTDACVDAVLGEEAGDQIRVTAVPRGSKFYSLSFCGSFLIFLTLPRWHHRAEALPFESNGLSCPGELRCRA